MEGKQLQDNLAPSTLEEVSNSKACHKGEGKYDYKKHLKNEKTTPEGKPFDTQKERKAPKAGKSLEEKWKDVICFKCGA